MTSVRARHLAAAELIVGRLGHIEMKFGRTDALQGVMESAGYLQIFILSGRPQETIQAAAVEALGRLRSIEEARNWIDADVIEYPLSTLLAELSTPTQRAGTVAREVSQSATPAARAPSRRVRAATGLAVRVLPPDSRQRYREEYASELGDLPRCDQAPHACRLLSRSWSLRRSLSGQAARKSVNIAVMVTGTGGAAVTISLAGVSWPGVTICGILTAAALWIVGSDGRTGRLASLIRAARGEQPSVGSERGDDAPRRAAR